MDSFMSGIPVAPGRVPFLQRARPPFCLLKISPSCIVAGSLSPWVSGSRSARPAASREVTPKMYRGAEGELRPSSRPGGVGGDGGVCGSGGGGGGCHLYTGLQCPLLERKQKTTLSLRS